jgi:trimeric autotransporter adhesin
MPTSLSRRSGHRNHLLPFWVILLFFISLSSALKAQRLALVTPTPGLSVADAVAIDVGAVPSSQPMQLTLRLAVAAGRKTTLDQSLATQITPSSPSYHQWLTPPQFATQFGATDDQISAVTAWLLAQGFTVGTVSPAKTRIAFSGTAAQVQSAFAVTLRRYQLANAIHFANSTQPSIPLELEPLIAGVDGLDDIPATASTTLTAYSSAGPLTLPADSSPIPSSAISPRLAVASVIDADTASILVITTTACSTDFVQSDYDAYRDLFRQANSQGTTILATSGCGGRGTGSFPASLGEVTALTINPTSPVPFTAIAGRPAWQSALGLPADSSRYESDLTTSSLGDFVQTLTGILQKAGTRQGNINSILYQLAPTPNLYTQPDATVTTPVGTWEPATGLGLVNLALLAKDFPLGTAGSSTSIVSSNYSPTHGQSFTLTATVAAGAGNGVPTGTVTFSSTQDGVLGASSLQATTVNTEVGTYTTNQLSGGAHNFTASYSGDATYASSVSPATATVIIQGEPSQISAAVVPGATVGGNVTVNITVAAASGVGAPSGTVTVTPQGTSSTTTYTGTLTRSGAHSATATVSFPATQVGGTILLVNCSGDVSLTCFSPISVEAAVGKAAATTKLTLAPASPVAGQTVTLTAVVSPAGTTLATGTIAFMDGATLLNIASLAAGSASSSEIIPAGKHLFTAVYAGDSNFSSSTSNPLSPSMLFSPALALTSNVPASGALAGLSVGLTATVLGPPASTISPTGTVALYDTYNGAVIPLGSPILTPTGPNQSIAVFTTTALLAGSHAIYAIYSGDGAFDPATSSTLGFALSDYTVAMNPETLILSRGSGAQIALMVGPVGGFHGTVTFACTPPANTEMTCSFSSSSLAGGGWTTMTLTTTAPPASATATSVLQNRWNLISGITLAMLFALPRRRRTLTSLLLLVLCVAGFGGSIAGCGNGQSVQSGSSAPSDQGTPLGTQFLTITAAGGDGVNTVRHTYQYQVTVQ